MPFNAQTSGRLDMLDSPRRGGELMVSYIKREKTCTRFWVGTI